MARYSFSASTLRLSKGMTAMLRSATAPGAGSGDRGRPGQPSGSEADAEHDHDEDDGPRRDPACTGPLARGVRPLDAGGRQVEDPGQADDHRQAYGRQAHDQGEGGLGEPENRKGDVGGLDRREGTGEIDQRGADHLAALQLLEEAGGPGHAPLGLSPGRGIIRPKMGAPTSCHQAAPGAFR